MDCIFCKIVNGILPSEKIYEDEELIAFKDINPVAPIHILIIPKIHIDGMDAAKTEHTPLLGKILITAKTLAEENKLEKGYRILTNIKEDGGQTVRHLHFHLIGGRQLDVKLG